MLFGDVLSKLPDFYKKACTNYDVTGSSIMWAGLCKDKGLSLPAAIGNSEMLLNVFRNLVENAVKYSDGEVCNIEITSHYDKGVVVIDVIDRGIGVPKDEIEYVFFERYQATNAQELRTAGTGLGLYQCKELMRLMGGKIEFISSSRTILRVTIRSWKNEYNDSYN